MVSQSVNEADHQYHCTFDDGGGGLELCVDIDAKPEPRDFFFAIPLGAATVLLPASGLVTLVADGEFGGVHTGGDPLLVLLAQVPGDLNGDGVVDASDALRVRTMDEARSVAANFGRKIAATTVAGSKAVGKGEVAPESDAVVFGVGAWSQAPQPVVVHEPGTYEHLTLMCTLHVPASTSMTILAVLNLRGSG